MVHVNKFHLSNYPTDFTKCGGKIPNKKILGARSLWQLDFAWWCQAFADPQYGTCFMAPLWHLKLKRWLLYSYKICALLTLGEYIFGSYCLLCMKLKKMIIIQRLDTDILHLPFTGIYRICNSRELPEKHVVFVMCTPTL